MLLRFEVSNHRSIMAPVELSMIAVDSDRPATRGFERLNEQALTIAGIYGPNASGKSNLLEALAWLSNAVSDSLRGWDEAIPREPFKFGHGPSTPSTYEVEVVVREVRHTYRLEVDDDEILFEGLYSYPERRRRTLFERDGMSLTFRRGLSGLSGTRELLTPTTLALSAAMRLDEPEINPAGRFIAGLFGPRRYDDIDYLTTMAFFREATASEQPSLFGDQPFRDRESALTLMRLADPGIDDVQIEDETLTPRGPVGRRVRFLHRTKDQRLGFRFDEESEGTREWFAIIGKSIVMLKTGAPLLLDEIDRSLHPRLSARLIELFQDPATNPQGAQLIFTSHDTSLLNHLNRDEVWLTEKGSDGATTLTALAEYGGDKVRRSMNLERAYLQGRFGAVPDPDQATVRRVLGLTTAGSDG